ncbi:MAG: ribosome maturation factor RimP [Clostridiales bacterium]|nr:ribosome maturation factor RimP [Clostridiales bacterium]
MVARSQLLLWGVYYFEAEGVINNVIERARPVIEAIVSELGYELVDIEYKTLYGDKHLIVYIAKQGGVSLDDCELVSNALDGPLDALDPTGDAPYCLDVSSPGLDRPFKTQRDFERNYGEKVEVKLYAPLPGQKTKLIVGVLVSKTESAVTVEVDGKPLEIENQKIALVRPFVEF